MCPANPIKPSELGYLELLDARVILSKSGVVFHRHFQDLIDDDFGYQSLTSLPKLLNSRSSVFDFRNISYQIHSICY